jgi:hypothetical protein
MMLIVKMMMIHLQLVLTMSIQIQIRKDLPEEQALRTQKVLWEHYEKMKTFLPGGNK